MSPQLPFSTLPASFRLWRAGHATWLRPPCRFLGSFPISPSPLISRDRNEFRNFPLDRHAKLPPNFHNCTLGILNRADFRAGSAEPEMPHGMTACGWFAIRLRFAKTEQTPLPIIKFF